MGGYPTDPKLRKIPAKSCAFINPQPPQRHHTAQGAGPSSWEASGPITEPTEPPERLRPHGPGPRESDPPGRLWPHGPAGKFRHHGPGNRTLLGGSGHTAQGNPTLLGSSGHTAPKTGSSWEVRPHHPRSGTLQRTIVASSCVS